MIYMSPDLEDSDCAVLSLIDEQRDRLKLYTQHTQRRWLGSLRRATFARAIRGSNSIEGYHATFDQAMAAVNDEPPLDEKTETWFAIMGYRDALTYIGQAAQDPYFEFSKQFLKSLHFMMLRHDMAQYPGQWRPGGVFIIDTKTGQTVYEAPDADHVNPLIEELVAYLKLTIAEPTLVRAAMAHLNLTMIHPYKDGNGRMARALQTLVIARDGLLHPVFSSIEEWLGRHTDEYYAVLAETGQGRWNPQHSAQNWVRFCLRAHYQQAMTLIRRAEESAALYDMIMKIIAQKRLHERMAIPLYNTAHGLSLTNARYRGDAEVSEFVASKDLKSLCEAGLLEPVGERKGRIYRAAQILHETRQASRISKLLENPYDIIARKQSAASGDSGAVPRFPGI